MSVAYFPRRNVLFVSNGGICRAPMAAGVLSYLLQSSDLGRSLRVGSVATSDVHVGAPPDPLAMAVSAARGYDIRDIRVRQMRPHDFHATRLLAVDAVVLTSLRNAAPHGLGDRPQLLARYAGMGVSNIVDPYGGTTADYEMALNLIEASCKGLVAALTLDR